MSEVRVRFAPSPTGYLHVGGARTALFNWLFARHEGGRFILRIEDTDVERSSEELEAGMREDLAWLGLRWDEGPGAGGGFGPYRQSERIGVYRELADSLVSSGKAYPCFCTDEELTARKEKKLKEGLPPQYDARCRYLSDGEREGLRKEGRPESVRFIVGQGEGKRFDDLVRGEIVFPAGMVGDFIVVRSNGLPTYNYAAVVDDSLMRITHVIRGEEHLPNTLRQLMLYEALEFDCPRFAHIPLILGPDRSKLSKRHGAPNIADFRKRGYPAEAIVNYLAFLGWSAPDRGEILSMNELVEEFSLERVSLSPSIFDEVKLDWVSEHHIREGGSERYFDLALDFFDEELRKHYSRSSLRIIFDTISENLSSFSRIADEVGPFRPGPPELTAKAVEVLRGKGALLSAFVREFGACGEWNGKVLKGAIEGVSKETALKGRGLYMPLRAALTGVLRGPDLTTIMTIRGREDVVNSLERAVEGVCG